jgi:Haem-NO-binding
MKGVVFNLLEAFIAEGFGQEKYEEILGLCPLATKEPFVGPGTYPDTDLFTIAGKAAEVLGVPLPDALRAFGKFCFPRLAAKVPTLVATHTSAESLLRSVEGVIHVEVRKLMPNAVTPSFAYAEATSGELVIEYRSARKLCWFMEGLLDGLALHFGERLEHRQIRCMHQGHSCCEFGLRFLGKSEKAA